MKDNERAVAEIPPEVRGAGLALPAAYGLRLRFIHGPPALPVAYGLRVILGKVWVPVAGALPLPFAWALGDDMVVVCCRQQPEVRFMWLGLNPDAYNRI